MTPLTKEQAEALAEKLTFVAKQCEDKAATAYDEHRPNTAMGMFGAQSVLTEIAEQIRDGTFIEVQP